MKKILAVLLLLMLFVPRAQAASYPYTISSWDDDISVSRDAHLDVTEKLAVNFEQSAHGLIRTIPYRYQTGSSNFNLRYHVIGVTDADGHSLDYSVSHAGDSFTIKIGNPDILVSGAQSYVIKYQLERAIGFFENHDELYFNVTGTDNPTAISQVSALVHLPGDIGTQDWQLTAFMGVYGSSNSPVCGKSGQQQAGLANSQSCFVSSVVDGHTAKFAAANLGYQEGFTIVAGWPKGIITKPSAWQEFWWFIADNWIYSLILILPLLAAGVMYLLWRRYGRDPKFTKVISPEFDPPGGLLPTELGTVIDDSVDMRDIVAGIIDLARRGFLKIVERQQSSVLGKSTGFELVKLKDFKTEIGLKKYEQLIMEGLFATGDTVSKEDLQNTFYKQVSVIKASIYDELVAADYFSADPDKVRQRYRGVATFMFIAAFFLFNTGLGFPLAIGIGLAAAVVWWTAKYMPRRTEKGVDLYGRIKGFEMFMNTAERYRQKFFEDKDIFDRLLPYAISLDIVNKWAKAFHGIDIARPDWYETNQTFNAYYLALSLNNFTSSYSAAMISAPRTSAAGGGSGFSGGFSGGGFGGGGTGSW